MYELRFLAPAEKYFKKIKEKALQEVYKKAFADLSSDPYCGTQKKGDLAGVWSYDVYYKKNNYEIAYRIYTEPNKIVVVILAGTRENFYTELKRYMR